MSDVIPVGQDARNVVTARDLDRSAVSGVYALNIAHSFHHRQLRSRRGPDTPANLVLTTGTGTTEEHGWIHANPLHATLLGYMIPSYEDPETWPIYRRDPFGVGWDWFLQKNTPEFLEWFENPISRVAAANGVELADVDDAVAQFRELVSVSRSSRWW